MYELLRAIGWVVVEEAAWGVVTTHATGVKPSWGECEMAGNGRAVTARWRASQAQRAVLCWWACLSLRLGPCCRICRCARISRPHSAAGPPLRCMVTHGGCQNAGEGNRRLRGVMRLTEISRGWGAGMADGGSP